MTESTCPFCGSEQITYDGESSPSKRYDYKYICNKCGRRIYSDKPPIEFTDND